MSSPSLLSSSAEIKKVDEKIDLESYSKYIISTFKNHAYDTLHNNTFTELLTNGHYDLVDSLDIVASKNYINKSKHLKFLSAIYAHTVHHVPEIQKIIFSAGILRDSYPDNSRLKIIIGHEAYNEEYNNVNSSNYVEHTTAYNYGMLYREKNWEYDMRICSDITVAMFAISLLIKRSTSGKLLPLILPTIRTIINTHRNAGLHLLCISDCENDFRMILGCFLIPPSSEEIATMIIPFNGICNGAIPVMISENKCITATAILHSYITMVGNGNFPTRLVGYHKVLAEADADMCQKLIEYGAQIPVIELVEKAIICSVTHCIKMMMGSNEEYFWNDYRFTDWLNLLVDWGVSDACIDTVQEMWISNLCDSIDKKVFVKISAYWDTDIYIIIMMRKNSKCVIDYIAKLLTYAEKYNNMSHKEFLCDGHSQLQLPQQISSLMHSKAINSLHFAFPEVITSIINNHPISNLTKLDVIGLYYGANKHNCYKDDIFSEKHYAYVQQFSDALAPVCGSGDYYGIEKIIAEYAINHDESIPGTGISEIL